jgi:hypothetical protein
MGVLADCRSHYDRYLSAIRQAQTAAEQGAIGEAAAAVERAGGELAALAGLAPGVAALRRSEEVAGGTGVHSVELTELAGLVRTGRSAVEATVAALRERQAGTMAELAAMAGVTGPYAPAPAGSLLLDRSA